MNRPNRAEPGKASAQPCRDPNDPAHAPRRHATDAGRARATFENTKSRSAVSRPTKTHSGRNAEPPSRSHRDHVHESVSRGACSRRLRETSFKITLASGPCRARGGLHLGRSGGRRGGVAAGSPRASRCCCVSSCPPGARCAGARLSLLRAREHPFRASRCGRLRTSSAVRWAAREARRRAGAQRRPVRRGPSR
jgi:hypothetical protein